MSDFGHMYQVRTRKPHHCIWCGEQIPVASEVGNYRGMFDGEWQNWYMHQECETAYQSDWDAVEDGFMPYSNPRGGTNG